MKKTKTYEISIIDKTYSKIISDETKFYTSDTALELGFKLKETDYTFESAEIVLLNIDDRSLVTRPVAKVNNDFVYELDDDIIPHYGEWHGQLRFKAGETYVSSPVKFRIENDLSNDRPPQLSDVQSWVSLKKYADGLVDELKQAVLSIEGVEDTFNENETERQQAEQERQSAEKIRQDWFDNSTFKLKNLNKFGNQIEVTQYTLVKNVDISEINAGDKIYTTRNFISVNGTGNGVEGRLVFGGITMLNYKSLNSNVSIIDRDLITRMFLYGNLNADINGINLSYFNDLLIINLTKTFGAGNEPNVKEMDELIKVTGYFDGEISLSQKQMFIWLLKITRNNTNAIISMGGTI